MPLLRFDGGEGFKVDLDRLYESRLLIQGVSGSGKSTLIRSMLEQTYGKVPHLVVDFDGDFVTLREKYDYVLVGPGGDVPIATKTAKITVRRLAELGSSAIFDISDMKFPERREWVKLCCEELVHLPRTLWSTRLFVLDEAHIFAPERGTGESVSTAAVIDLITLGRKRGLVAVCATQRLSKFHKDAAGELNNKLIGFTDDVDLQRAGDQLGMTKDQRGELKRLETHTFYGYGPAISRDPILVRTKMPATKPPPRGQDRPSAPPARSAVKKILEQLGNLPKEAEEEARTVADLQRKNADLTRQIRQLEKDPRKSAADPATIQRAVDVAVSAAEKQRRRELDGLLRNVRIVAAAHISALTRMMGYTDTVMKSAGDLNSVISSISENAKPGSLLATKEHGRNPSSSVAPLSGSTPERRSDGHARGGSRERPASNSSSSLARGEKSVLIAIAPYPDGAARDQLTVLTGYKRSTRDAYIQRLATSGYVDVSGASVVATDEGIAALGNDYEPLPEGEELQEYWLNRLPEGERKILQALLAVHPEAVRRETLEEETGYKRSTRDAYIQRLMSRRLVEEAGRGEVRPTAHLFEGGR